MDWLWHLGKALFLYYRCRIKAMGREAMKKCALIYRVSRQFRLHTGKKVQLGTMEKTLARMART